MKGRDNMEIDKIDKDVLAKFVASLIIGLILLGFMLICLKFGLTVGSAIGELVYNIQH